MLTFRSYSPHMAQTVVTRPRDQTWYLRPSRKTRQGKAYHAYLAACEVEYGPLPLTLLPLLREAARLVAELSFADEGAEDRTINRQHLVMLLRRLEPYRKHGPGGRVRPG